MVKSLFIFAIVILPLIAQAKLISLVSAFFHDKFEESVVFNPNSQKINLLQAPTSPYLSIGGGDITVVDDALLSESGPSGSQANLLKETGQIGIYVVQPGDTLSQIADLFGVSTNTIKWGNDIKTSTITPGQTLIILPVSGVKHTVASGDSLNSLAKTYKGEVEEIMNYNNLSSDTKLAVGDTIIIPGGILPQTAAPERKSASASNNSSQNPVYEGYYMRPISGGRKSQGIHGYNGVDLATQSGIPIMASADGLVTVSRQSGWNGGYGNYIVISHSNGTQTLYAHNSSNIVSVGERVSQGQVIGYVGSTGRSSGPHVHFEVRGARNPF